MQTIQNLPNLNGIAPFIAGAQNYYSNKWSLGGGVGCAIVAAEMAIRAVGDLIEKGRLEEGQTKDSVSRNFSANFGGAIFYGLCAANILPGTAILGSLIFTVYSFAVNKREDNYLATKVIRESELKVLNFVLDILQVAWDWVIYPVADALRRIFSTVFDLLVPKHPIWIGVALLVTAIAVVKLPVLLLT